MFGLSTSDLVYYVRTTHTKSRRDMFELNVVCTNYETKVNTSIKRQIIALSTSHAKVCMYISLI